jgi:hypothetical protein
VNDAKYIGLDLHHATISAAVLDSSGKLLMECVLETKAATVLRFLQGLRGSLHVCFEEGTCAAWLRDLLKPHVAQVVACDPRENALLKVGITPAGRRKARIIRKGFLGYGARDYPLRDCQYW